MLDYAARGLLTVTSESLRRLIPMCHVISAGPHTDALTARGVAPDALRRAADHRRRHRRRRRRRRVLSDPIELLAVLAVNFWL